LTGCSFSDFSIGITEKNEPTLWSDINNDLEFVPSEWQTEITSSVNTEQYDNQLGANEKKERAAILIKRAEYLANNNEYSEAASLYERVLRLTPSREIERKLAHIAFRAKKFQRSSDLYKKFADDLYQSEREEFLYALRYTGDGEFQERLAKMDIPEHLRQAFRVSWICENEFISCEKAIREYPHNYGPIVDLKNALKNYEALGNNDASYKEALLIGAFYKNKDYTTAMKIWENLLRQKPDYRPILKIVGFSAFMINQYERAQWTLTKYKKLEPKDAEADFILWLIQFEKQDYETSNIYFNKAVLWGYKPKTVVERKLAYNYYVLGLYKNMFQVLWYLVLEKDATEADIVNAIYLALVHEELRNAGEWISLGKQRFQSSDSIAALEVWYLRANWKTSEAQGIVDDILSKSDNIIALVQWWILAHEAGYKEKSKTLLTKAKVIDAGGTWAETINEYLGK
jgi:tetratricopeptide (TPR) repeat protein